MINSDLSIKSLEKIFEFLPQVKLVYFFGSRVTGKIGPLSDYDFAVYLDEKDFKKRFDIRLDLLDKFSRLLKTDNIDLLILNDIQSPELKYSIIKDGKLIYKKEPFNLLLEPKILNEYFDFMDGLKRYGLTKSI